MLRGIFYLPSRSQKTTSLSIEYNPFFVTWVKNKRKLKIFLLNLSCFIFNNVTSQKKEQLLEQNSDNRNRGSFFGGDFRDACRLRKQQECSGA